jgi:hypothetical protein
VPGGPAGEPGHGLAKRARTPGDRRQASDSKVEIFEWFRVAGDFVVLGAIACSGERFELYPTQLSAARVCHVAARAREHRGNHEKQ